MAGAAGRGAVLARSGRIEPRRSAKLAIAVGYPFQKGGSPFQDVARGTECGRNVIVR